MKDILETIISRRSVKKFKPDMVDEELIEKVIKAGTYAPTGKNLQSPIILAVTNKEIRDELSRLTAEYRGISNDPFYSAPVALVVLADKTIPTYIYDGSCVMENMLLEAHSLGLGACWIHHAKFVFETDYAKGLLKQLGVDDKYEGIGTCVLGIPEIIPEKSIPRKQNYVYYLK